MSKCLLAGAVAGIALMAATPAATAQTTVGIPNVPGRTAITVNTPFMIATTANGNEARPGLSTVKLYIADFALRHGDGSAEDRALAESAIRYSDDNAAMRLYLKYPNSINAMASEYGLTSTNGAAHWGNSTTSTRDTATFLQAKQNTDPGSPVLGWMRTAAPVAADGTHQNWGTAHLPGVEGTKWGWSDYGPSVVASASFGPGFSVAANTYGTADQQTADVLGADLPITNAGADPHSQSLQSAVIDKTGGYTVLQDAAAMHIPAEVEVPTAIVDQIASLPAPDILPPELQAALGSLIGG